MVVTGRLDGAHRPDQVRRHVLGDDPRDDAIIYEDNDDRFFVGVNRDLAGRFVFVPRGSKIANEDHFLRVEAPIGRLTPITPRGAAGAAPWARAGWA